MVSSAQLLYAIHAFAGRPLKATLHLLADFWPPLLTCLAWGALTYAAFYFWFGALDHGVRYSRLTRIAPGLLAVAVYVCCVLNVLLVEWLRGKLTRGERDFILGALRIARPGQAGRQAP